MDTYNKVFDTICCICSKVYCTNMVPLLNNSGTLNCYGQAVITFSNIEISNKTNLPNKMCTNCLQLLKQAIKFKKMCEESHRNMKFLLTSINCNESIQENIVNYCILKETFPEVLESGTSHTDVNKAYIPSPEHKLYMSPDNSDFSDTQHENNCDIDENTLNKLDSLYSKNVKRKCERHTPSSGKTLTNKEENIKNDIDSEIDENTLKELELLYGKNNQEIDKSLLISRKSKSKRRRLKRQTKIPEGGWECEFCHKKYALKSSYYLHKKRHDGAKLMCEHCGKGFVMKSDLHIHQVNVHGKGDYIPCPHCDFKASRTFELNEHVRVHTGERPFACEQCGRSFRRRAILRAHMLYHSEKMIQCSLCPRRFHRAGDLSAHCNNVHERRYMYSCRMCPVTYAKAACLRRHLTEVHDVPRDKQGKVLRVLLKGDNKEQFRHTGVQ